MNLSQTVAYYGLRTTATPTGTNITNDVQIGVGNTSVSLSTADVAYSLRAIFAGASDQLALYLTTGSTIGSTAWVAGTAQVETATAAGTITASGNATVVVTAAGMTGSPKTISVAVTNGDTAAVWAGKVRTALAADADVSAILTTGGSTTAISIQRKPTHTYAVGTETVNIYPANDATLNISLDNGTCTGITTAATSANTTVGVATDGVKIYDGDGKDFEGITIPTMNRILGVLYETSGSIDITVSSGSDYWIIGVGEKILRASSTQVMIDESHTYTAGLTGELFITVIGESA